MSKSYLFTGEKKVGKTTALVRLIDRIGRERCGGFYTEEIRENDKRVGFRTVTLSGATGLLARVGADNLFRVGKFEVYLDWFNAVAVDELYAALQVKEFVIIDEIGPMQLLSDRFRQAVCDILNGPRPLLGTIVLRHHEWADVFKEREDLTLYELTLANRDGMIETMLQNVQRDFPYVFDTNIEPRS